MTDLNLTDITDEPRAMTVDEVLTDATVSIYVEFEDHAEAWTPQHPPVDTDRDEIAHRLAQSTATLTELRRIKRELFDQIREEVERHRLLVRAARIYGITATDDVEDPSHPF
jgi:hypothetical protein